EAFADAGSARLPRPQALLEAAQQRRVFRARRADGLAGIAPRHTRAAAGSGGARLARGRRADAFLDVGAAGGTEALDRVEVERAVVGHGGARRLRAVVIGHAAVVRLEIAVLAAVEVVGTNDDVVHRADV